MRQNIVNTRRDIPLEVLESFLTQINKNCKESELKVIKIIVDRGPSFVRDIFDASNRTIGLTNIRNIITRLVSKYKILVKDKYYTPTIDNGSVKYDIVDELKILINVYIDQTIHSQHVNEQLAESMSTRPAPDENHDIDYSIFNSSDTTNLSDELPIKVKVTEVDVSDLKNSDDKPNKNTPRVRVFETDKSEIKTDPGHMGYLFSSDRGSPKSNVKKITSEIDELKYNIIDSNLNSGIKKKLLDKLYEMSNILNNEKGE